MADPAGAGEPADPGHHVVRGQPGGLVDDDQPVRPRSPAWPRVVGVAGRRRPRRPRRRRSSRRACGTGRGRRRTAPVAACARASASAARARATRSSMCRASSGRVSATKASDGVCRSPVCRPTSERISPVALSSAAAVPACSSASAVDRVEDGRLPQVAGDRASVTVTKPSRGSLTRARASRPRSVAIRSASLFARAASPCPSLLVAREQVVSLLGESRCRADSSSISGAARRPAARTRPVPRRTCAAWRPPPPRPISARRCRSRCPVSATADARVTPPQLGDDRADHGALLLQRPDVAEQQRPASARANVTDARAGPRTRPC